MAAMLRKRRRRHGAQFKQEVLVPCEQPGAPVAGVSLAFGLNANLVRQWRHGDNVKPNVGQLAVAAAAPMLATAASLAKLRVAPGLDGVGCAVLVPHLGAVFRKRLATPP